MAELDHTLIVGQTKSGKTTFCRELAGWYKANGVGVVVCDPFAVIGPDGKEIRQEWGADWITQDPYAFLAFVKDRTKCLQCALFVDEGGDRLPKYDPAFRWLTTSSRHHGHVCHVISWKGTNLDPTLRQNCMNLVCFNISGDYARELGREFNVPDLADIAPSLPKGHYVSCNRFSGANVKRGKVWWAKDLEKPVD